MKNRLTLGIALFIIILSGSLNIYVYVTRSNSEKVIINDKGYTIDEIFFIAKTRVIDSTGENGAALDDLIIKAGVAHPERYNYTIIGADGYQKTVKWGSMKNGLLTRDRVSIFPDLPKAYQVKNIVKIEVK
ncbi:MAG: hypothetical protein QXS02_04530 [Candidatus Thermoplasmatota archaeon]